MLSQEIADMQQNIYSNLRHRHLHKAFALIHVLIQELHDWQIDEKLNELETSYQYMIRYMLDGINDPERKHVYNHLLIQSYQLTDIACEKLLSQSSLSLYYGKKRYLNGNNRTLSQTFTLIDNKINELSLSELIPDNELLLQKRKDVEYQAGIFFDMIWTNYPAEAEDYATLRDALHSHRLPDTLAALTVSALTLNIIHCFDEEKLDILIDTYCNHESAEVQLRALCGILIALMQYHTRITLFDKLRSRISLLLDNKQLAIDMRNMIFQFIRSRDTEKISRKMTEEVLPKMMKISPSLYKKIREDDTFSDLESLEYNPEWQELLEQSGISDHLKELNDLQMQGADVLMSTFSHLKGFPFFNELSNWFIPFIPTHSTVTQAVGSNSWGKQFSTLLQSSSFMCNSDKYSFCLSLSQVPESQRQMMAQQFDSQNNHLKEEAHGELYNKSHERENISNRYIQDLYRFIKLHPHRKEFYDIFATPIEKLLQIDPFSTITHDEKLLKVLGEYLFKNECYTDAVYIFTQLSNNNFIDNELYQKIGYCYQSVGEYDTALEYYLKADLIKPDNAWTLRRIATCYRNLKKTERAIEYFLKADAITPDNLAVNLNIGHCYLEMKQYNQALKYYFKVDYLDSRSHKARRPIAWCSFLSGKFDQAWQYYEKILADKPSVTDYLNAGHVALALNQPKQAVELYTQSIKADNNNLDNFTRNYEQDYAELTSVGISPDDIPIIYDQVLYKMQELS